MGINVEAVCQHKYTGPDRHCFKCGEHEPFKVCEVHGQQVFLGQHMPCASPVCGCGIKAETLAMAVPDHAGLKCTFERKPCPYADRWEWHARPCIALPRDHILVNALVDGGWGTALVGYAKPAKPNPFLKAAEKADSASIKKYMDEVANAIIAKKEQPHFCGLECYALGCAKGGIYPQAAAARQMDLPADYQEAIARGGGQQMSYDALTKQIAAIQAQMAQAQARAAFPKIAVPAKPAKPQRREVSVDGRNWINYDRLADGDAFDVYPHRRVDGVVVAMGVVKAPLKVVGRYGPNAKEGRKANVEVPGGHTFHAVEFVTPSSSFVRRKPWLPSIDETDLLPDVG